jgi:hypothetical protein
MLCIVASSSDALGYCKSFLFAFALLYISEEDKQPKLRDRLSLLPTHYLFAGNFVYSSLVGDP